MKKTYFNFVATILLVVLIGVVSSCKKEEAEDNNNNNNEDPPTSVQDSFFAKIDGVNFNPTTIITSSTSGNLQIQGSKPNGQGIQIKVPASIAAGNYTFNGDFGNNIGLYIPETIAGVNNTMSADSGTGSLVIISNNTTNKIIKGTFSFVATPSMGSSATGSVNITQGTFEVNY